MPNSNMQVTFYVPMLYLKSIKWTVFAKPPPKTIKDFINAINLQYFLTNFFPEFIYINSSIFTITVEVVKASITNK